MMNARIAVAAIMPLASPRQALVSTTSGPHKSPVISATPWASIASPPMSALHHVTLPADASMRDQRHGERIKFYQKSILLQDPARRGGHSRNTEACALRPCLQIRDARVPLGQLVEPPGHVAGENITGNRPGGGRSVTGRSRTAP